MMILATFSPAADAAAAAGAPKLAFKSAAAGRYLRRLKANHSQRQIPMAVKDGKAPKLHLKNA